MISGQIVEEMKGCLFSAPPPMALGHCVSADAAMGGSVFRRFHQHCRGLQDIVKDMSSVGSCIVINDQGRPIYNLVVKEKFYDRATLADLRKCLQEARNHMIQNHVTQLALPRLGQGHDCLLWTDVYTILEDVFRYTRIKVIVFTLL